MALDTNLMLKASGALTETTTGSVVDFGNGDLNAMTYIMNVTSVSGSSPTMDVTIQEADTPDGTYRTVLSFPQVTAAGQYFISGRLDGRYRKYVSTLAGTSPSFTFSLGVDMAGRYNKY